MAQWATTDDQAPAKASAPATSAPATSAPKWATTDEHAADDDSIIRSYGYDPAVIKKAHLYGAGDVVKMSATPVEEIMAPFGASSRGADVVHPFASALYGGYQLAANALHKVGIASDADRQYADLTARIAQDAYRRARPNPSTAGQIAGTLLLPVPGGTVGKAALGGAVIGATDPVEVNGPDGDYWSQKGKQVVTGAVTAPVIHGVVKGAGKVVGKVIDKTSGKVSAEDQAILDLAKQYGIEGLTYGDVTGSKTGNVVDTTLENIPFTGAGSQRARQQQQVKAAAERVAQTLKQRMQGIPFEGLQEVANDAKAGEPEAQDILHTARAAGDDDEIQQSALNIRNYLTKKQNAINYEKANQIADELPNNHVEPEQTLQAIDGVLKQLQDRKIDTGDKARMIRMLEGTRGNLTGKTNSYRSMRELSDDLGAQINGYYQANPTAPAAGVQWLQRVKSAVDTDLDQFTRQGVDPNAQATAPAGVSAQGGTGAAANTGTAQQGTANAQPNSPSPGSSDTAVKIPGSARTYGATYEVRELGDVQPSHNGQTFSPNPRYKLRNDRNYNNPANQRKVVDWSTPEAFDPSYHVTDNPDAVNGPPVIEQDGTVLGGNGRTMIMQRVYSGNPEGAAAYRKMLEDRAAHFGIDPAEVAKMKQPVLVRVLDDAELTSERAKQDAITDLNKTGTAALTPAEQAVADARRVSAGTLEKLSNRLQELGPDATTAQAIEGKHGVDILRELESDGVIAPQEMAKYADEDSLTPAGKQRIQQLLLGRFFRDADQLDGLPAAIKNKVERIAGPLAKLEAHGDYSLTDHVKQAVDLLEQARAHNQPFEDYLEQSGLFGKQKYSEEAQAIALGLRDGNPTKIAELVNKYAGHAHEAANYQGPGIFGDIPEPKNPRAAFNDAFGTKFDETKAPPPPEPAAAPKPSASFEQSFQPEKRPDNPQKILDRLRKAARDADDYFIENRVPFKDRGVANATKTDEADTIYNSFIKAERGDKAQKFWNQLDDKGRAAVRYSMVSHAIAKATDSSSGVFSPKKFVSYLEKYGDAKGVFFKGSDKWEMDGFQNLMAHLTRAGQYAENPPTGQRLIPYMLLKATPSTGVVSTTAGAVHAAGLPAGIIPAGMVALARFLFTTPTGRNFLLSSSSLKPGTRAMDAIVNRISGRVANSAARAITSSDKVLEFPGAATGTSQSQRTGTTGQ